MDNAVVQSADQLLGLIALVIFAGVIFTKISKIVKLPDVVLYILAGIILGPHLLNWVNIDKFPVENQLILSFGAAFILYDGGREIDLNILNRVKLSIGMLSSVGVLISAGLIGFFAYEIFDMPLIYCLLLGAVIASTDPSVLVPLFKKMNISDKLKQSIISESAFNDAAGAVLVFTLISIIMGGTFSAGATIMTFLVSIGGGLLIGIVFGYLTHLLIDQKKRGIFKEHAALIILISVLGAYLLAEHFHVSGFVAVFLIGIFCGNKQKFDFWIPEESFQSHLRFKEITTVIMRMMIFVLLGTHLNFDTLFAHFWPIIGIVMALIFIVRPLSVLACVMFDKKAEWSWREIVYLMWTRETGVIPAALAGMIMTAGIPHGDIISAVTFATILITLTFQASTARLLAKILKLELPPKQSTISTIKEQIIH